MQNVGKGFEPEVPSSSNERADPTRHNAKERDNHISDVYSKALSQMRNPAARESAQHLIDESQPENRSEFKKLADPAIAALAARGASIPVTAKELKNDRLAQEMLIAADLMLHAKGLSDKDIKNLCTFVGKQEGSTEKVNTLNDISKLLTWDQAEVLKNVTDRDGLKTAVKNAFEKLSREQLPLQVDKGWDKEPETE